MKTATCRSCGAGIVWAKTKSGKLCPFDLTLSPEGKWGIDDRQTPPLAEKIEAHIGVSTPGFTSHFATCPDALKWRRRPVRHASRGVMR